MKVTSLCKEIYLRKYAKRHEGTGKVIESYGVKEASNMKKLVTKIIITHKQINENRPPTDEEIVLNFIILMDNRPKFYRDKDIPIINSGYNNIIGNIQSQDYKF